MGETKLSHNMTKFKIESSRDSFSEYVTLAIAVPARHPHKLIVSQTPCHVFIIIVPTSFSWRKAENFPLASLVFVRLAERFNISRGFMARVMGILKPEANHKKNTFHGSSVQYQRKCWRVALNRVCTMYIFFQIKDLFTPL